ncbi:MAG: DUF1925 domain-containing protein [Caldiserica bacterium]|jgi:alpha-amylase/alpha-mannosidase (GH57 family)|nr:DUF1925 domain-containing protein [Caldisericota bacterium]MDH7562167.1 DUF1925 domain-containing protein [Caldisericota bacterium]
MKRFILCIHNHQPVGNFGEVFQKALKEAYVPFLQTLRDFPSIKVALHNSGPIFEFLKERNQLDYLNLIRELLGRGQLELLSGGFWEPILPLIPEEDIISQVEAMNRFLKEAFNFQPRGLWLAERVWESSLIKPLRKAGMEFTFVDDNGFQKIGLAERDLDGYFITEDEGISFKLFPISKPLRYLIPGSSPEEAIQYIKNFPNPDALLVFGDDGEKFGLWPGTSELLYRDGWLRRFFELLSREETIKTIFPSEALNSLAPKGRVYLPPSSYEEMEEWSLPARMQLELKRKKASTDPETKKFIRGGFFQNFLSKYPESNRMHKRMLFLKENLKGDRGKAFEHYLRGQCNCAYWHGVFGGLYFPFLRDAVYREFLQAEGELGFPEGLFKEDFDRDGLEEIILMGKPFNLFFHSRGGRVMEWDDRPSFTNLTNVMTRYLEAYHLEAGGDQMVPDPYVKENFLDHFLDSPEGCENSLPNLSLYQVEASSPSLVRFKGEGIPLKEFSFGGGGLEINLEIERRKLFFAIELNLSSMPNWEIKEGKGRSLFVPFYSLGVQFEFSREVFFRTKKIFTVSASQAGLERIYQGTSLFLILPLGEGKTQLKFFIYRK